jgi:hypothetical protein
MSFHPSKTMSTLMYYSNLLLHAPSRPCRLAAGQRQQADPATSLVPALCPVLTSISHIPLWMPTSYINILLLESVKYRPQAQKSFNPLHITHLNVLALTLASIRNPFAPVLFTSDLLLNHFFYVSLQHDFASALPTTCHLLSFLGSTSRTTTEAT